MLCSEKKKNLNLPVMSKRLSLFLFRLFITLKTLLCKTKLRFYQRILIQRHTSGFLYKQSNDKQIMKSAQERGSYILNTGNYHTIEVARSV